MSRIDQNRFNKPRIHGLRSTEDVEAELERMEELAEMLAQEREQDTFLDIENVKSEIQDNVYEYAYNSAEQYNMSINDYVIAACSCYNQQH